MEEALSFGHETNLSGAHPAQSVVDRFEGPNAMSYLRHMQEWFKSFSQKLGRSAEIYKGVDEVVPGPPRAFQGPKIPTDSQSLKTFGMHSEHSVFMHPKAIDASCSGATMKFPLVTLKLHDRIFGVSESFVKPSLCDHRWPRQVLAIHPWMHGQLLSCL